MARFIRFVAGLLAWGIALGAFGGVFGMGTTAHAQQCCRASCPRGEVDPETGCCPARYCRVTTPDTTTRPRTTEPQACTRGHVRQGDACVCPENTEEVGGRCLAVCSLGATRDPAGVCQCPIGQEPYRNQCIPGCAGGQIRNAAGLCECPVGMNDVGGRCLGECPAGFERAANGTCGCSMGLQLIGGSCVAACRIDQFRDPSSQMCSCPRGTMDTGTECIARCPAGQIYQDDGTCGCPAGRELVGGRCIASDVLYDQRVEEANHDRRVRRGLIFGGGLGGIALAGVGAGLWGWSQSTINNTCNNDPTCSADYEGTLTGGKVLTFSGAAAGIGLFIGGLMVDVDDPEASDRFGLACGVAGSGLLCTGRF